MVLLNHGGHQEPGSGDDEGFYAVALQMAAREARSGYAALAQDLKELVGRFQKEAEVFGADSSGKASR